MHAKQPGTNSAEVILRQVVDEDLPIFFEHQWDEQANWMAVFTWKDPGNRQIFEERWSRIRADEGILIRTILVEDRVAGSVLSFDLFGELSVSYWLGRDFWGRGIATSALMAFIIIQD